MLYQVKDLFGIKSGTFVVSSQKLVSYQVNDLCGINSGNCVVSSPIHVLMYWGGMPVLWTCFLSILEYCVVSILESCVVSRLETYVVSIHEAILCDVLLTMVIQYV